jgi:hypothetical protein
MLDRACERLWEKKVELSLGRIRRYEEQLSNLEAELDELLRAYHQDA